MLMRRIDLPTDDTDDVINAPALCFSKCGDKLFHGTATGTVRCWDLRLSEYVWECDYDYPVTSIVALPNDTLCMSDIDNRAFTIRLEKPNNALVVQSFPKAIRQCAAPGDAIVVVGAGFLATLDSTDLRCQRFKDSGLGRHRVFSVGKRLFASSWDENRIRLLDLMTLDSVFQLPGHDDRITSLAISPTHNNLLSSGMDEKVLHWSLTDGHEPRVVHTGDIALGLEYAPDGTAMAMVGLSGNVALWDAQTFELVSCARFPSGGDVSLTFSPDGSMLAVSSDVNGRITIMRRGGTDE